MAKAYIVGAGPGDPRLLTIAAVEALQEADVILCDRLVSAAALDFCKQSAEVINVGKTAGEQEKTQTEIFEHFARYADRDCVVLRLKGGDPCVFGRGSEEYIKLKELGYDVITIPGISAAVGLPTLLGIPLTARDVSSGFAVVTGHNAQGSATDWSIYARIDTLVILMAVRQRAEIAQSLIRAGRSPHEPIAFIENGGSQQQKIVRATLEDVANGLIDVESPAVFVVGPTTRLLYEERPQPQRITYPTLRLSFATTGFSKLRLVKSTSRQGICASKARREKS
jgi:uroporphyrin-III C-methyltransferase